MPTCAGRGVQPRRISSSARTLVQASTSSVTSTPKPPGSVEKVFASLSGRSTTQALPDRFRELKRSIVRDEQHAQALTKAWQDVLASLDRLTADVQARGSSLVPTVEYPGDDVVANQRIEQWMDKDSLQGLKERGTVILKNVVPKEQALAWKDDLRKYIEQNPHTHGELASLVTLFSSC